MLKRGCCLGLGLALTVLMVVCASCGSSTTVVKGPEVGTMAPDFSLATLGGQSVSLSSLQGKPILLNFWATYCSPCRVEMPYMQAIFEEKAGEGLVVIAINVGEDESLVRGVVEETGITFPTAIDFTHAVSGDYQIRYIPATFFIDDAGAIKSMRVGAFRDEAELSDSLESIMK